MSFSQIYLTKSAWIMHHTATTTIAIKRIIGVLNYPQEFDMQTIL